jgi:protoheme ferro-lyase
VRLPAPAAILVEHPAVPVPELAGGVTERNAAGDPVERSSLAHRERFQLAVQLTSAASLLAELLEFDPERIAIGFQSRFGREPWLEPDTANLLKQWGKESLDGLDVICPGFSADCLETLEEIDVAGRKIFTKYGGTRFRYIPALNRRTEHIGALAEIAIENLAGWMM